MPGNALSNACMSLPRRQARECPLVTSRWQMTLSPTLTPSTPGPIASTQPAFSCPMMYGSLTSTLLRQMPSTICRSVRQTPAPPTRTITSSGREIFGSVTSSYLTNSFAVSFSSNAWSTAPFIYLSLPLVVFYFLVAARAPSDQLSEQGVCQADNKLIFLTFSAFWRARPAPHRTKLDGASVPRRNTLTTTTTSREEFGFSGI